VHYLGARIDELLYRLEAAQKLDAAMSRYAAGDAQRFR